MSRIVCFLLFFWAIPVLVHAQAAGTCGPSQLGQPCSPGGLAVAPGAEPGLNLGAGNPIHIVTGNKYQQEIDLPANADAPGIEIVRHYNSLDRRTSVLGTGWSLSYDTRLFFVGGRWQIVQADGSRILFSNAQGKPLANPHGTLKAQGKHWVWTWPTGRQLWFDAKGYLVRLLASPQIRLDIQRNAQAGPLAGTIEKVSNRQGRSLEFAYRVTGGRAYLSHIDSALGRFAYQYEAAAGQASPGNLRLASLGRPDGMRRRYLYEPELQAGNALALTGIEIVSADQTQTRRTNTWGYDRQGRAVLSVRGGPDSQADRISLRYVRPVTHQQAGLTVVADARRQQTRFETAMKGGRYVLTRVEGAGCAGCAAPGTHADYDGQGRLREINGTRLQRDAGGAIRQLEAHAAGWPGLILRYRPDGYRASWTSALTGTESVQYNAQSLPSQRRWANGDSIDYDYDVQGRPVRLVEKNAGASLETTLRWRGGLLVYIGHDHERESRQYDRQGRLSQRSVERTSAHFSNARLRYTESFEYDQLHRIVRHHLPEGGSLHYRWGADNRLAGISWHDAMGQAHTVIDSKPGQAGYCYGNGLCLETALDERGQASRLSVVNGARQVWSLDHHYDKRGRLRREQHAVPAAGHSEGWNYAYDNDSRLAGARKTQGASASAPSGPTLWYAWNGDGSLAASRKNGVTRKPSVQRDASGLPTAIDGAALNYGPNRRLAAVTRQGKTVASYLHNAFGHRIVERSSQANTDYFYLNNQLVAESRSAPSAEDSKDGATLRISRRYIYANHVPVGFIDYPAESSARAELFAVHADLIGAPKLVTDASQNIRWLGSYSPTGAATRTAGDLTLDLRLPGQVFDAATGWHDNLLRTYLPDLGQYLEPDPLGPVPGNQALGYANQQARRYADPLGLILFAFDGTRNNPATQSNVWKLSQAYRDGPAFYHAGPGDPKRLDWDAATAWQASRIIEEQWQSLLSTLEQFGSMNSYLPIDILGYSRGAALGRHFGNLINRYVDDGLFSYTDKARGLITACVDLRFMGLFDTVAQFGLLGANNANYDLTIAPAWEWVAHAVALHERRWLYPLASATDTGGENIVEAPFIGAHADIGGGVSLDSEGQPDSQGDLADVALNWMLWQARAASLQFDALSADDLEITDPILHDERSSVLRSVQNGDRAVQSSTGSALLTYQDDDPRLGRSIRTETEGLITRAEDWRGNDSSEVGMVDMAGYAQWLQDELGWQMPPA